MARDATFLADGEGVIDEVSVSQILALPAPPACPLSWGHVALALNCQSEIPIVLETSIKLVFIKMLGVYSNPILRIFLLMETFFV